MAADKVTVSRQYQSEVMMTEFIKTITLPLLLQYYADCLH